MRYAHVMYRYETYAIFMAPKLDHFDMLQRIYIGIFYSRKAKEQRNRMNAFRRNSKRFDAFTDFIYNNK